MAAISRLPLTASKEWRPRLKWVARILMPSNVNFAHPESDDVRRAYVHCSRILARARQDDTGLGRLSRRIERRRESHPVATRECLRERQAGVVALSRRKQGSSPLGSAMRDFFSFASMCLPTCPREFASLLFSSCFAIAAAFNRSCSAARVYRSTSLSVLWPVTAMISCALHPASASRRAAAFRSP